MTHSAITSPYHAPVSRSRLLRPGIVHGATLVVGFLLLFRLTRNQWFFFDEWNIVTRLIPDGSLDPLRAHVGQLVAMPLVAYKVLFSLFGLRTYQPYMAALLVAHVGLVHMIWRVMRRAEVDAWLATALAVVFLFFGPGYEGITWATQIGLDTALLLGILQVLLVDHEGDFDWRDWLAGAAGVVAVLSLGAGVILAVAAGAVALVRRGARAAAVTTLIPVGFYAIWYVAYGRKNPGTPLAGPADLLRLPDYIWIGLTRTVESVSGLTQAGSVIIVALLAWLVARRRLATTGAAPAILTAAAAPLTFAVIGIARLSTGLDQAASSRYLYTGAALMLPAIGLALTEIGRRSRPAMAAVLVATLLAAVHGSAELVQDARNVADQKQQSKALVLAAARLVTSGEMVVGTTPDPHAAPILTYDMVKYLQGSGKLPPVPAIAPAVRLAVAAQLQLAVTEFPLLPPSQSAVLHPIAVLRSATDAGGCQLIDADGFGVAVTAIFDRPGSLALTPSTTGGLGVLLADLGDREHTSPQRNFGVSAGRTVHLNVSVRTGQALLALPRGTNRICGALSQDPAG